MENQNEGYISVKQVADHLGIKRNTVLSLIKKNGLPAVKIGKLWKIKPSELEDWIKKTNETRDESSK